MLSRLRPSLIQLFVGATLVVIALAALASWGFAESLRRRIVERSEEQRNAEAQRIKQQLAAKIAEATKALDDVERGMRSGTLQPDDPVAVEARLYSELLDHPTVSDATLTYATSLGWYPSGKMRVAPDGRWQVSVFRASADPDSELVTRLISGKPGKFDIKVRWRPRGGEFLSAPLVPAPGGSDAPDPTENPTFEVIASEKSYGKTVPSDISWSELDDVLPQSERRAVLTIQKAVEQRPGHFAGVLRIGLFARTIDALPHAADTSGPARIVLCDERGRLVARLDPSDRIDLFGDDLRIVPTRARPEIAAALTSPLRSGPFSAGGTDYLATFSRIEQSQDWYVGVIVPEGFYTRDLRSLLNTFLVGLCVMAVVVFVAGFFVLGRLRRSLDRVVDTTARMRRFDFAPSPADAPLRDVAEVMEGVERAKTSMRALGKYVPIDLVRQLYASNREPELGGEIVDLSMMFTDIEGFTTLAERLQPDALAKALGAYLAAMTRAVHSTGGTVDKFIGDAVMAFWNAPTGHADHPRRACRAVLACMRAERELYASPAWAGLPALFTRYGVHRARVMVGHFGAPDRLSYTALGDGVNLAARLEPLCKQYGLGVLASETIVEEARDEFAFRLIDKVAVKGKTEPVRVYELLGAVGTCDDAVAAGQVYEQALAAYFARDFARARAVLAAMADDPPSRVLVRRCDALIAAPPPGDWNGVYVAKSK
jgi:adenylate cyclase